MQHFLANLIWVLHILFVLFFVSVPFLDIMEFPELHVLHLMCGPLLFVHWLANSDECALTRIEMFLRGDAEKTNSFFYNLVQPIYQPTDDRLMRQGIWVVSIALWLITLTKFIKNPCVFRSFLHKARYGTSSAPRPTATLEEVVIVQQSRPLGGLSGGPSTIV